MLPEGHRLHVVLEGISRGFSAVNIRKFVLRASRLHDLVELGSLTPRGRGVPRGRRSAPGSTSWSPAAPRPARPRMLNCLAAAIPGGERVVSRGGGLRAALPAPRLGADADPAGRARGHRRDQAARPGQGEPADAAEPDHRRRGPGRGVPRPAARPQRRPARACARSTPTAPARRWSRCARCRCWRARTSRPGSSCRPSPPASTSSSTSASTSTAYAGSTRSSACPAGSRTTSSRPSRSSSARGGELRRAGGMPPRPERFERVGIDVHRDPQRGALMGALVGLGVGVGLLLVWSAFSLPRRRRGYAARPAGVARAARRGPGSARSSVAGFVLLCVVLRRRRRRWSMQVGLADAAGGGRVRR